RPPATTGKATIGPASPTCQLTAPVQTFVDDTVPSSSARITSSPTPTGGYSTSPRRAIVHARWSVDRRAPGTNPEWPASTAEVFPAGVRVDASEGRLAPPRLIPGTCTSVRFASYRTVREPDRNTSRTWVAPTSGHRQVSVTSVLVFPWDPVSRLVA